MCPVKTTNLTVNVCREESQWWGKLAAQVGARSRGDLQKLLLFVGLERIAPARARELKEIRRRYCAAAVLTLFAGIMAWSWVEQDDETMRRTRGQRVRVVRTCSRTGREIEI